MQTIRMDENALPKDPNWISEACEIPLAVWSTHYIEGRETYVCVAARSVRTGDWVEVAFLEADAAVKLRTFLREHPRKDYDLYWCPNPFDRPRRQKKYAVSTPLAWCDIDKGNWRKFRPIPSIVWKTSPGRTQGIWFWNRFEPVGQAEAFSRALAYHHAGDRNGWSCTKLLRMPYTYNHKPEYQMPRIEVLRYKAKDYRQRPKIEGGKVLRRKGAVHLSAPAGSIDWRDVVERYKSKLPRDRYRLMKDRRVLSTDRSRCIFMIVQALHAAGATPAEIASVLWESPYFVSKYGLSMRSLRTELSRILSKLESEQ